MAAVILAVVWQGFPFFAVTLLAGMQAIPFDLYEAAAIDGAGPFVKFRYVTLPGLAEVIATTLLLRMIWVANSLDLIFVMTGGGPGTATQTLPLYAFLTAWSGGNYGDGLGACRDFHVDPAQRRGDPCAADPSAMIERKRFARGRRLVLTELPIVAILGFALLPWMWMMLSSFRPDAELTQSPITLMAAHADAGASHRAAAAHLVHLEPARQSCGGHWHRDVSG